MEKTKKMEGFEDIKDVFEGTEWSGAIGANNTLDTQKNKYTLDEKGRRMIESSEKSGEWIRDSRP